MEEGTEKERHTYRLEDCYSVSDQVLEIEMSLEEFMNQSVPFPGVFIQISRIPEILVKLSIRKTRHLCVEIRNEIKHHKKTNIVGKHNRLVPT